MSTNDAYTDVVELCALLQCLGFSVKSLNNSDANASREGGTRTVVINCQTSGLHVVLESASLSCSCPVSSQQQTSGVWEVCGVSKGKQLEKEFGCSLLGSLPKGHRERLTTELREMIRCIKASNESDIEKSAKKDKSASLTELKTPEKLLCNIKADTPTRYRSLDTLTAGKESEQQLPTPGLLRRPRLVSECEDNITQKMCSRQSTYTLSSTPGSVRRRNKTSSPINGAQHNLLESLLAAEKTAEDLRKKLSYVIKEFMDNKDDSSISSLALDVSKISVLKAAETSKVQFASSPNLSGIPALQNDLTQSRLKRHESVSTSNLNPKSAIKESKMARLRRISPNLFKRKDTSVKLEKDRSQDGKNKLSGLYKPKIVTPVRVPKSINTPEATANLSTGSKKKYSHIKSTIPRPAKKD